MVTLGMNAVLCCVQTDPDQLHYTQGGAHIHSSSLCALYLSCMMDLVTRNMVSDYITVTCVDLWLLAPLRSAEASGFCCPLAVLQLDPALH